MSAKWVAAASTAVVTPFVLSACYGAAWDPVDCFDEDADGDGFWSESDCWDSDLEDCDDGNPDVNPGVEEVCDDGVDNNCDGIAAGADQDEVCGNGLDDDCDGEVDERPDNPGSEVECDDGLDNDCDGLIDLEDPNCRGIADGDTDAPSSGDIALVYVFDGPAAAMDCESAGISVLSVELTGPELVDPFDTACDDRPVALNALANGEWSVELSATSVWGDEWLGVAPNITVAADQQEVTVDVGCLAADGISPCTQTSDESR